MTTGAGSYYVLLPVSSFNADVFLDAHICVLYCAVLLCSSFFLLLWNKTLTMKCSLDAPSYFFKTFFKAF